MKQEMILLEKLGYDSNDKATLILKDLVLETIDAFKNREEEEVKKLVNTKDSYIYIEYGCFYYEIGLKRIWEELERIHLTRDIEKIDTELYTEVYGGIRQVSIQDTILEASKYIVNKEQENQLNSKELTEEKVSIFEDKKMQLVMA